VSTELQAANGAVGTFNGAVGKALERNTQYVVASDKEFLDLPKRFFFSALAR
jgi:hypothetical protein